MSQQRPATKKLLIVQQVLKQYRVAFFQQLAAQLALDGIELTLCFSLPQATDLAKADNITELPGPYATLVPLRQFGPLVWQQVPPLHEFDLVIVEQANRHLLNYLLLLRRLFRPAPKLIFWGHGFNHQASAGVGSWLKEQYKKRLLRCADGFFAYTQPVARYAQQQGVAVNQITVLNNSIDTTMFAGQVEHFRRQQSRASPSPQMSPHAKAPGFTLLFCGALYPDKKIPLLLQTAKTLADQKLLKRLIVLGDGPDRALLTGAAAAPWLDYRGACFGDDKAAAYAEADLVLHPGLLGLAVLDAFAAGLPLVTTFFSGHSPELAYLEHGVNGLIVDENLLASRVQQLLLAPVELAALADGALKSAGKYSLASMVQAFAGGVHRALSATGVAGTDLQAAKTPLAPAAAQPKPLRVLQIHNFYQQRGGEDVVVESEALLLQQAGVELHTWYVDSAAIPAQRSWWSALKFVSRLCWNRQAQQQLQARLQAQPVDVIHLHNSFPLLSPALIHTAQALGVPLVLTVHNFRWCHPSGSIRSLAEVGRSPWRYLGQAWYRDSRAATAIMILQIWLHQWLGTYQRCARLLCPSQFVQTALLQAGFNRNLLQLKPHSVAPAIAAMCPAEMPAIASSHDKEPPATGYALFVGRADAGKGLYFLLEAWQQLDYPLWIVGVCEAQAKQWPGYRPHPRLRFLGVRPAAELGLLYQQATLLLVPSLVAETFGNVVIEAFAHGTPCLVSDAGGLPELLWPRHNGGEQAHEAAQIGAGQMFSAGNTADFIEKTRALLSDPKLLQQMSEQAQRLYQRYYLPQYNTQALLACYQQVLAEQGKVVGG